jgi:hypothetical protein
MASNGFNTSDRCCDDCTANVCIYSCLDCIGVRFSKECILSEHWYNPLHRIQVRSHVSAQLTLLTGHPGFPGRPFPANLTHGAWPCGSAQPPARRLLFIVRAVSRLHHLRHERCPHYQDCILRMSPGHGHLTDLPAALVPGHLEAASNGVHVQTLEVVPYHQPAVKMQHVRFLPFYPSLDE